MIPPMKYVFPLDNLLIKLTISVILFNTKELKFNYVYV